MRGNAVIGVRSPTIRRCNRRVLGGAVLQRCEFSRCLENAPVRRNHGREWAFFPPGPSSHFFSHRLIYNPRF